jgi:hypothetical protein
VVDLECNKSVSAMSIQEIANEFTNSTSKIKPFELMSRESVYSIDNDRSYSGLRDVSTPDSFRPLARSFVCTPRLKEKIILET